MNTVKEAGPPRCPACGDAVLPSDTWWTQNNVVMHNTCNIKEGRLAAWRAIRRSMVLTLAFPCAQALGGRNIVEPLIEPIGAEVQSPSQVLHALMRLKTRLLNSKKLFSRRYADEALLIIDYQFTQLRHFLGRP